MQEIPIIEPTADKKGYWEIYKDDKGKITKKIYHKNMSLETLYQEEKQKRDEDNLYVSLDSGESFEGQFVSVEKDIGKFGEINKFIFMVEGKEKVFNSKSIRLLKAMVGAGIKEGDIVKITKKGERYETEYEAIKL